jgi:hypothetical protein
MRRTITVSAALLVAALSLAGCSAGGFSASEQSAGAPAAETDSNEYASQADVDLVDREVIVTGGMLVTVDSPVDATNEAIRIAESSGGRVDSREEYAATDGNNGGSTLVLRLPSKTLTATLDKLKALGEVERLDLSSTDVTAEIQDLDARISALSSAIDRLHALLAKAKSIEDLITLETEITSRQGDLESMQAQQRYYADEVSLSTITVELVSVADAPVDEPDTFLSGLGAGWGGFVAFVNAFLVLTGVLLPWLVFFAIIGGIVWFFIRRRIKARA